MAVPLDVNCYESIDDAVAEVEGAWGESDILVNNAALFDAAPTVEITRGSSGRLMVVNVTGVSFSTQAVARDMIARGQGGKIINMASQAGRRGGPLVAIRCATKAVVISFT